MGHRHPDRKHADPANTTASGSCLHQSLGGAGAGLRLSAAFYSHVEHDAVLRPLYGGGTLKCPMEVLASFLTQLTGGPNEYSKRRWSLSLREAHLRFPIGPEHREAWLKDMRQAMDELKIQEPARSSLYRFFEHASTWLVNQPKGTADESALSRELHTEASANPIVAEVARRWDALRTLESAVAAVRRGDAQHAVTLAEGPILQNGFQEDRGAFLSLLAVMCGSTRAEKLPGTETMLDYVRGKLSSEPGLARETYTYGRTLLHEVAGHGSVEIVELLLRLGADPNARDVFGHTPLYSVGNASGDANGGAVAVVRALVQGGADVNARDDVKRCTALHMAARRGNVRVAEALLDCGADIEARDIAGDTPLRRAVNCAKVELVALLLSRGADVQSRGNKGLTPREAARSNAMKDLLRTAAT
jgi:hemoglobin